MAIYESEHTKFMREWMEKHPQELEEQKEGRALWWDKGEQDLETARRNAASQVPQKPYYYDIEG
jgi:dsDNA-binding SOS-regulon protein